MSAARDIIAYDLMDQFHWTPDQLNNIPYKTIQKILLIRNAKSNAVESKQRADEWRNSQKNRQNMMATGRGSKKSYREV